MRKRYWPEVADRKEPIDYAQQLTDHTLWQNFINNSPAVSPFEEYYNRAEYADANFKDPGESGWKSDCGRIYMICGKPDNIDKGNLNNGTAGEYVIWYYNRLNEKFVFIDDEGFGDYRLEPGA